jgi:uncharacterized protein (TIGR03790 family)
MSEGPAASLAARAYSHAGLRSAGRDACPTWHTSRLRRSVAETSLPAHHDHGLLGRCAAIAAILLTCCISAAAQGPENVLLVINGNSPESRQVGEYYRQKRGIPESNICLLSVQATESVDRQTFDRAISAPIAERLSRGGMQDKILYIVLTKGVPFIVIKTKEPKLEDGSVDSQLALLYSAMLGLPFPAGGKVVNPYFLRNARGGEAVRFSHRDFPIYLVTRLDGYTVADAKALVDRAIEADHGRPAKSGRFVLDERAEDETPGNKWLSDAAARLRAVGMPSARIELEASGQFLNGQDQVMGYASWGSNDPNDHSRYLKNHWLPGALMTEFVSTNARTFERPPDQWNIGSWKDSHKSFFHDSPQTLIGDAIHEGVTGVAGNVSEPLLDACVRPQALFPLYVKGLNLAESFYGGTPFLNWKGVVIGDPLTAPFAGAGVSALAGEEANPPVNRGMGLPAFFAHHMVVARSRAIGEKEDVTELLLVAERARRARDFAGAHAAAEQAFKRAPESPRAMELMAEYSPLDQALPLFRKVVEISPQNGGALNNLAYLLATKDQPKEALPFAARAADIGQGKNGATLDTYGWVLYLLGQYPQACTNLERAAALVPANATITYHLGMCYIKAGRGAEGKAQLERALTLQPDPVTAAAIRRAL